MTRIVLGIFLIGAMTGCGTFRTISQSDSLVSRDLNRFRSNCESVSRIYSGIGYDVCLLNSSSVDYLQHLAMGFYIFDTIPSAVADTLALPYTGVMQYRYGNFL